MDATATGSRGFRATSLTDELQPILHAKLAKEKPTGAVCPSMSNGRPLAWYVRAFML